MLITKNADLKMDITKYMIWEKWNEMKNEMKRVV